MSSSETKMDEMIAVQVSEQDYAGMLVPKKCDEQEKTEEKQREADNGTGQPPEADNGTGQAAEAHTETGQPAEADNGTGQPAEADNETGQAAEADNGTGQPLFMTLERPMIHIEEYTWPEEDEEFDGRNVVVIGINGSREAEEVFDWYMTTLHREEDLVVVVYAMEIGPRLGLQSIEDWSKETQRIIDTQKALRDLYRRRFINPEVGLKMNGAIVSRKGESGQLIVKEANERKAAYIIIGKRSQDANLHQVVTNSTTDYVLCNANCPVLVCKMDPNSR